MFIKHELKERLKDMELFAKTIGIEPFELLFDLKQWEKERAIESE